jgi:hypothetical protein
MPYAIEVKPGIASQQELEIVPYRRYRIVASLVRKHKIVAVAEVSNGRRRKLHTCLRTFFFGDPLGLCFLGRNGIIIWKYNELQTLRYCYSFAREIVRANITARYKASLTLAC